jgi:methionyl-tRNA formyltransferase
LAQLTTSRSSRLRLVFFGTGGILSASSLRAVSAEHDVAGVVRAMQGGSVRHLAGRLAQRLRLRAADPLTEAARDLAIPQWPAASMRDPRFLQRLVAARPDLLCVAHFPWRIPDGALAAAPGGGVNLHPSLLPRHRGPLPLFWIYHADDRQTGVTAHVMTAQFDRGDILAQQSFPLPRGYPADDLNAANAKVGAEVLRRALLAISRGEADPRPQDDTQATDAPFVRPGRAMVDFDSWDVERVWHFLAGVWPRYREPLADVASAPAPYGGVLGYSRESAVMAPLGRVRPSTGGELALQCLGGIVRLAATPR